MCTSNKQICLFFCNKYQHVTVVVYNNFWLPNCDKLVNSAVLFVNKYCARNIDYTMYLSKCTTGVVQP